METKFIPTNPEELVGFDNILAEFNEINGTKYVFTDNYMVNYDVYIGMDQTADGYDVWTMVHGHDTPILGESVYMYEPSAYDIFNFLGYGYDTELTVYVDYDLRDIEEYMINELCTNYDNYLAENEDKATNA